MQKIPLRPVLIPTSHYVSFLGDLIYIFFLFLAPKESVSKQLNEYGDPSETKASNSASVNVSDSLRILGVV